MSIRKVVVTKKDGVTTEHHGKGFKNVVESLKGQNVEMFLQRHDEAVIGYSFTSEAKIGNCSKELTWGDYWTAYDKII